MLKFGSIGSVNQMIILFGATSRDSLEPGWERNKFAWACTGWICKANIKNINAQEKKANMILLDGVGGRNLVSQKFIKCLKRQNFKGYGRAR